MRRNPLFSIAVLSGVLVLGGAGVLAGLGPAGAATSSVLPASPKLTTPTTAPATTTTTAPAKSTRPRPRHHPGPPTSTPDATPSATPSNPLAPLTALPLSLSLPITLLANAIGSTILPGQNALSGTNTTNQKSPLINARRAGQRLLALARPPGRCASSCSTTSVGIDQLGAIGNINIPITAQYNAIGLLGSAAKALGLTSGQSPASTTQNGAINAFVPVSLCAINVGLVGEHGE